MNSSRVYTKIVENGFFLNIPVKLVFLSSLELTTEEDPEIMLHARIPGSAFTTVKTL